jgi:hypothetical protein
MSARDSASGGTPSQLKGGDTPSPSAVKRTGSRPLKTNALLVNSSRAVFAVPEQLVVQHVLHAGALVDERMTHAIR